MRSSNLCYTNKLFLIAILKFLNILEQVKYKNTISNSVRTKITAYLSKNRSQHIKISDST